MSVHQEISDIEISLSQTTDERTEAKLLLELLDKSKAINSTTTQPYIHRLLELADSLGEENYKAWAWYHEGNLLSLVGDAGTALEKCHQALAIFQQNEKEEGTAIVYAIISLIYLGQGNFRKSIETNEISLELFKKTGDKFGLARIYNNLGLAYSNIGDYTLALNNYQQGAALLQEIGNNLALSSVYNNIGNLYMNQGDLPEALKIHFSTLKLREEVGDQYGIATSLGCIANVYTMQGSHDESLNYHFKSLKIFEAIGDKNKIAMTHNNIGVAYQYQQNYQEAIRYYQCALLLRQEIEDKNGIALSYSNIGIVYALEGNDTDALSYQQKAREIYLECDNNNGIANCDCYIGQAYFRKTKYEEAIEVLNAAIVLATEMGLKGTLKDCYLFLSKTNKVLGNFEKALEYHELYFTTNGEILGEQAQRQLNELSFKHNVEQKDRLLEIEHLRNVELKNERDRAENLLLNILPAEVAEELKESGKAEAKHFDQVTVLFTDFIGFTKVSQRLTPQQLVGELHTCFQAFDEIVTKHNIEKIKTMGDAYLAVAGLPAPNTNHAMDVVQVAMEILQFIKERRKKMGDDTFDIRIGIHTGAVVAGIVGVKKFAYDIWGDTVNTAARMEQNSETNKINISETTYQIIKDKMECEYRGEIEAKNKGKLKMYFVK